MKITVKQLRSMITEAVAGAELAPGEFVDTNDKMDMLQPGDQVKINGRLCTIVSMDHLTAHIVYVLDGKSVKKTIDYRYALSDEDNDVPEVEIEYVGRGAPPARTRRPALKHSPVHYD